MNITWIVDLVLYVFISLGLGLYALSVRNMILQKKPESEPRSFTRRILLYGECCVTLMFCIGVLHQTGRLSTLLAAILFLIVAVCGLFLLQLVRRKYS